MPGRPTLARTTCGTRQEPTDIQEPRRFATSNSPAVMTVLVANVEVSCERRLELGGKNERARVRGRTDRLILFVDSRERLMDQERGREFSVFALNGICIGRLDVFAIGDDDRAVRGFVVRR